MTKIFFILIFIIHNHWWLVTCTWRSSGLSALYLVFYTIYVINSSNWNQNKLTLLSSEVWAKVTCFQINEQSHVLDEFGWSGNLSPAWCFGKISNIKYMGYDSIKTLLLFLWTRYLRPFFLVKVNTRVNSISAKRNWTPPACWW